MNLEKEIAEYIAEYEDKLDAKSMAEGITTHILGKFNNGMHVMVEGESILPHCMLCGEEIKMDPDRPFMVGLEPYQSNYPHEPDVPEEIYLICFDCIGGYMLDYYPGSDE
jgi:hypothetical protein